MNDETSTTDTKTPPAPTPEASEKNNPGVLGEAAAAPTLDYFYEKDPDDLTDEQIDQLIAAHQQEHDDYLAKIAEKETRAKKVKTKKRIAKAKAPPAETAEDREAAVEAATKPT